MLEFRDLTAHEKVKLLCCQLLSCVAESGGEATSLPEVAPNACARGYNRTVTSEWVCPVCFAVLGAPDMSAETRALVCTAPSVLQKSWDNLRGANRPGYLTWPAFKTPHLRRASRTSETLPSPAGASASHPSHSLHPRPQYVPHTFLLVHPLPRLPPSRPLRPARLPSSTSQMLHFRFRPCHRDPPENKKSPPGVNPTGSYMSIPKTKMARQKQRFRGPTTITLTQVSRLSTLTKPHHSTMCTVCQAKNLLILLKSIDYSSPGLVRVYSSAATREALRHRPG